MTIGKPQPVEDSLKDPTNTRVSTVYTEGIECKLPDGALSTRINRILRVLNRAYLLVQGENT